MSRAGFESIGEQGFRSLKEEETVEFEISDNGGKSKAINVTGMRHHPRPPWHTLWRCDLGQCGL